MLKDIFIINKILKIKNSHNYKNINNILNDITKKKTKDYKNDKINGNIRNKNKSIINNNEDNFNNIKRKINFYYIDKDRRQCNNSYNKINLNNKSLNKLSQDYSLIFLIEIVNIKEK